MYDGPSFFQTEGPRPQSPPIDPDNSHGEIRDKKGGTGFPRQIMDQISKVKLSRKNHWLLAEDGSLRLSESRGR